MTSPPPRAPTFPRYVDQVEQVDDMDFIKSPNEVGDELSNEMSATPVSTGDGYDVASSTSSEIPVVPLPVGRRKSLVRGILLWQDPKVTGLYFGTAMAFFYMTLVREKSVISVLGMLIVFYELVGMVIVQLNIKLGGKFDKHVARPPQGTPMFRHDVASRWAGKIVDEGNDIQDILRDMLYCDKPVVTCGCAALGASMYALGKYFSVLPLLFVFTLALFSVPLVYEKNKKKVDEIVARATDKLVGHVKHGRKIASEKTAELLEKAPPTARDLAIRAGLTPIPKEKKS